MSQAVSEPGWGIAANVVGTKVFRPGARVWVLQFTGDDARVSGHSRGGRIVTMWVRTKVLSNPRVKWVHDARITWALPDRANMREAQEKRVQWIVASIVRERGPRPRKTEVAP